MSATDSTDRRTSESEAETQAAAPTADTSGLAPRFGIRDLVTPVFVVAATAAIFIYINTADLDQIEENSFRNIGARALDHILISFVIAGIVLVIAVSLGILVTRPRFKWTAPGVLGLANGGQAIPSIGLLALIAAAFVGFWAVVLALTAYAVLPVLRNTIVGIEQVDAGVKDAARGMGMSGGEVLRRVELVLAVPVIAAGARTALVLAVATVPFGQYLGFGGLGEPLFTGLKTQREVVIYACAALIALLALSIDWLAGVAQRLITPRGIA
ncbi:ABC transporter permease [Nocardioidaceae bacterium]|nr:ABC transporter permease [Nocardioidaceae bacterium]